MASKISPGKWMVVDRKEYLVRPGDPRWAVEQASGQEPFWISLVINEDNAKAIAKLPELIGALRAIANIGGNLPDERLTDRTGPNDARQRGIMYVSARQIARDLLREIDAPAIPKEQ